MSKSPNANLTSRLPAIDGSIVLGAALCVLFYAIIHTGPLQGSLIHKYTTEHNTEYAIVAVLCWGIADLLLRLRRLPREAKALSETWLPPREGPEPAANASRLFALVEEKPSWLLETHLGQRLRQGLLYVHEKRSAEGLDAHLRDLSERSEARTHSYYAVPRFVVWVTPVLGFLGTVVHFGRALGSLSPDTLADNLPIVTAGMGTAFDTTTMALAASMSIMLFMFLVERSERELVHRVDHRTERELSNRFVVQDASLRPFIDAVESASRATLQAIERATRQQAEFWPQSLGELQASQQQALRQQVDLWESAVSARQEKDAALEAVREERMRRLLETFNEQRLDQQAAVQHSVAQVAQLQQQFAELTATLAQILARKEDLLEMQQSLADNLRLLQQTQKLDEAMINLTAAIHLLTARNQSPLLHGTRAA